MIVTATGVVMVIGSATGNLAEMLGALFDPNAITTSGGSPAVSRTSRVTNGIKAGITGVLAPGTSILKALGL